MTEHKCHKEDFINYMHDDIKEIKSDTKKILAFQNKAIGLIIGIPTLISIFALVISSFLK